MHLTGDDGIVSGTGLAHASEQMTVPVGLYA